MRLQNKLFEVVFTLIILHISSKYLTEINMCARYQRFFIKFLKDFDVLERYLGHTCTSETCERLEGAEISSLLSSDPGGEIL